MHIVNLTLSQARGLPTDTADTNRHARARGDLIRSPDPARSPANWENRSVFAENEKDIIHMQQR